MQLLPATVLIITLPLLSPINSFAAVGKVTEQTGPTEILRPLTASKIIGYTVPTKTTKKSWVWVYTPKPKPKTLRFLGSGDCALYSKEATF